MTVILVFSAFLIILEYFGIRSEHWRKGFARLFRFLGRNLPKIGRAYLFIHPYLGIATGLAVTVVAALGAYDLWIGERLIPLWLIVTLWIGVIFFGAFFVPEQIRRIQGKNWPPKF